MSRCNGRNLFLKTDAEDDLLTAFLPTLTLLQSKLYLIHPRINVTVCDLYEQAGPTLQQSSNLLADAVSEWETKSWKQVGSKAASRRQHANALMIGLPCADVYFA
jgi:hypothetical protein